MNYNTTPTKTSFLWLMILIVSPMAMAQDNPGDSKPTAETEIICYAAKTKWVCAPADEKQRAHDKALQMAAQEEAIGSPAETGESTQPRPEPIAVPNLIYPENVRDFTAREEALEPATNPEVVATETPAEELVAATPTTEQAAAEPVVSEPVIEPVIEDVSTADPVIETPAQSNSNDFSDWQARYPNHWSLQVIGTSNRHKLDQFIIDQGLSQNTYAIVRTQVNQADWWVVLVGLYTSREAALANRNTLPTALSSAAWVRQIGSINGSAD